MGELFKSNTRVPNSVPRFTATVVSINQNVYRENTLRSALQIQPIHVGQFVAITMNAVQSPENLLFGSTIKTKKQLTIDYDELYIQIKQ